MDDDKTILDSFIESELYPEVLHPLQNIDDDLTPLDSFIESSLHPGPVSRSSGMLITFSDVGIGIAERYEHDGMRAEAAASAAAFAAPEANDNIDNVLAIEDQQETGERVTIDAEANDSINNVKATIQDKQKSTRPAAARPLHEPRVVFHESWKTQREPSMV